MGAKILPTARSLSGNSDVCVISAVACLFSCELVFPWFCVGQVILDYILDILNTVL